MVRPKLEEIIMEFVIWVVKYSVNPVQFNERGRTNFAAKIEVRWNEIVGHILRQSRTITNYTSGCLQTELHPSWFSSITLQLTTSKWPSLTASQLLHEDYKCRQIDSFFSFGGRLDGASSLGNSFRTTH